MSTPSDVVFIPDVGSADSRDAASTSTLDRIAHLAALATHATIAQINLLSEDKQISVAMHVDETRAGADTTGDPACVAARLKTPAGVVLGTVCVIDYAPREWSSDERAALAECAALAGEELASHLPPVATERSRIAHERVQRDVEAANRAKGEFLAVFSRELRDQLETLTGYAALLEAETRGGALAESRDELRRVQLGQRQLAFLIDEMLNYSSLERGAAALTLGTVGVHEAILDTEFATAALARAKAIFVTIGAVRDDVAVVADICRLHEILTHLLSNAVKFTGAGGRIDVACDATRTDVRIRVRDTGIGIPADKLDVIFEPFVQLRGDRDRTVGDAGLGLAISRRLARAQGGDLTVESTVGSGSTFTLTLPRAKKPV